MIHINNHLYRANEIHKYSYCDISTDIHRFLLIRVLEPATPANVLKCIKNNLGAQGGWIIDFIVADGGFFLDEKYVRVTKIEDDQEFNFKDSTYLLNIVPDKL